MIAARQIFLGRGGGAKLPYDAEVEYLESTGTQWIDTGFVFNSSTDDVKVDFALLDGSRYKWCFGSHEANAYCAVGSGNGTNARNVAYGDGRTQVADSYFVNNQCLFQADSSGAYLASTKIRNGQSFSATKSIYLFNLNIVSSGDYKSSTRIWRFSATRNGVLVRDLIPVRKDGVGYMYDRVSGQLFRNQGTGSFVIGPDVGWMNQYVTDGAIVMWDDKYDNGLYMADKLAPYISQMLSAREARAFSVSVAGDVAFPSVNPFNTSDGTGNFGRVTNVNTGTLLIYCGSSQGTQLSIGAAPKSVSLVVDGGVWTCYANDSGGSLVSVSRTAVPETTTGWSMSNIQMSDQTYKNIRIYNRALTAEEIAANYAVDKQRFNLP
jgi:hypothetical protein